MENINLIDSFSDFKEFKNIDRQTMMIILEEVFRFMLAKKYGTSDNFDFVVNVEKGDFEIWRYREIVPDGEAEEDFRQIDYSQAIKLEPDFEIGEEVSEKIGVSEFERREILTIRQSLISKVQDYEKGNIFKKYEEKVGEVVTGEVYQIWKKEVIVLDEEGIELSLPSQEQIPSDYYRKGESVRGVIKEVKIKNNNPIIVLSRTSPVFLERLFEMEVPEIYDGLITIKNIVRVPGERAKVAVESYDDRVDPVGACVGMKGSRIHGIVRELRNENIDVINFTNNTELYIKRALSPAKITSVKINEEDSKVSVYLNPDQVSLAIGKGGFNIRLAGELTGYEIDVYRDAESENDNEDVVLQEFIDEIDQWIIDELKKIGCDTAKSVLELSIEELETRTDLEIETLKEVIKILQSEFEN